MPRQTLLTRTSAMVVALVTLISLPTHASTPAGAQLGPVWIGGGLTSGGTLSYQLNLTVTSPDVLISKATLSGKRLKITYPVLTNSPAVGVSLVSSAPITIPTNFQGKAILRVRVRYGKRSIGNVSLLLTITAPPAIPPVPQTTWYDVGFSSNVVVNAGGVSTNGMTPPIAYAWTITDTDLRTNATFSSTSTNTPKLTTLPMTSFTNPVVFANHVAIGVDLDKQFDLDTNPNLVGFDTEQIGLTTYHLQVVVSDAASHVSTGAVTVISTSVSPAQPTLPLGERQYLTAMPNTTNYVSDGVTNLVPVTSAYSWSIAAKPSGSTAILENPKTRTPSLRPDKEGDYVLQLAIGGPVGLTNSSFVTVRGASYVGVATCASCHGLNPKVGLDDRFTPWSQTLHSTMAQRGIDGILSSHYNESCYACHTLGNNKAPLAVNGGFDDVQKTLGWKFPTVLQVGNYSTMPTNLQNLANIQCESCHGPGSQHPGEESTSLDVAVCATCHQDGSNHFRPSQWALGPHGADDGYLNVSLSEGINPSCSKCHSAAALVDTLEGKTPVRSLASRLTCSGCHDPHNMAKFPAEAHQVRVYDTVTLDDSVGTPITLTGQGPSAMCMYCHNARRSPPATYISSGSNGTRLPHESTATDVLLGLRASTNVQAIVDGVTNTIATVKLENSAHSGVAKCVTCHMYPGSNTVGDHTFSVTDRITGANNTNACNQCHAGVDPVTDFDHISVVRSGFPNAGNYDGTNGVQGVQTEVDGVMTNLINKLLATGMTRGTSGTTWTNYADAVSAPVVRAVQRNAAWNEFLIERELSHGVHNTAFTVRLLQWSYTVLSTNTGGNAYEVDFPNADLR